MSTESQSSTQFAHDANRRGVRLTTESNLSAAIVEFDRAIHFLPTFAEAFVNRGAVRMMLGQHKLAIEDLTRAIELAPDSVSAYCNRAAVRLATWDFDGAIQDCDAALLRQPECTAAFLQRGFGHYHKRDRTRCESDYRRAFELDPPGYVRSIVDQIQRSMKENLKAVLTDCEKHLKWDADDFHSLARRGIVKLFQGRHDEAEVDFKRNRELNPEGSERLSSLIREVERRKG